METLNNVHVLSDSEFDDIVKIHIPFLNGFEFAVKVEADNDTYYFYKDITGTFTYSWEIRQYSELVENHTIPNISTILQYLVINGVLPEGHYLIGVSW